MTHYAVGPAYFLIEAATIRTKSVIRPMDPAMMPNQARTRPSLCGFLRISLMASTPHKIAKGAGKTKTENKPR